MDNSLLTIKLLMKIIMIMIQLKKLLMIVFVNMKDLNEVYKEFSIKNNFYKYKKIFF